MSDSCKYSTHPSQVMHHCLGSSKRYRDNACYCCRRKKYTTSARSPMQFMHDISNQKPLPIFPPSWYPRARRKLKDRRLILAACHKVHNPRGRLPRHGLPSCVSPDRIKLPASYMPHLMHLPFTKVPHHGRARSSRLYSTILAGNNRIDTVS